MPKKLYYDEVPNYVVIVFTENGVKITSVVGAKNAMIMYEEYESKGIPCVLARVLKGAE